MKSESSWKTKIDPAFDQLIKALLRGLEETEMIRDSGWFAIKDEYVDMWEVKGSKGWYTEYEKMIKTFAEMSKSISESLIPKKRDEKELAHHRHKFRKELFKNIEGIPIESQQYHKEKLKPFYSDNPADRVEIRTKEDYKNLLEDISLSMMVIWIHNTVIETFASEEPSDKEVMKALNFLMATASNMISMLVHGVYIFELIREAKGGDQDSFFKALAVDRSIIESPWAIKLIRKAQMSGDELFFNKMAKAISKQPFKHDREFTKPFMIILLLWGLGLNKLNNEERKKLLEECGLYVQPDPEYFRQFVRRSVSINKRNLALFLPEK